MLTTFDYISWATNYLKRYRIHNAQRNAEELFIFLTKKKRYQIYLEKDLLITEELGKLFVDLVKKRAEERYPLQYIVKEVEFYGFNFVVLPGVFIPRPETELLVDTVLEITKSIDKPVIRLLDVGTGSGCIAISIAKLNPSIEITATDILKKAIKIAKLNASFNNIGQRISFIQSDLFAKLKGTFDIIVSNPPYVSALDFDQLQPEIRFEPRIALDGGKDGFYYIKKIIQESPKYLSKNGFLIIEIGFGQKEKVEDFCRKSLFKEFCFIKDYQGIERITVLKYG